MFVIFIHGYIFMQRLIWILVLLLVLFLTSCKILIYSFHPPLTAQVCSHRWGMDASFTQTSDQYLPENFGIAAEYYGLKYNLPLTVFDHIERDEKVKEVFQMGRIDFGVYSHTCNTKSLPIIRERIEWNQKNIENIRNGKTPVVLSYGCGKDFFSDEIQDLFLMGRNSAHTNDTTPYCYYGKNLGYPNDTLLSALDLMSQPSTTRYFLMVKKKVADRKEIVQKKFSEAIQHHGFVTDFCHWNGHYTYGYPREELGLHFENMGQILDTVNVYRGSYNDIAEYYYAREAVIDVEVQSVKQQLIVSVQYAPIENVNYNLVNCPVSVKVNLKGTKFASNDYKSMKQSGIRRLDNGDLVLDVKLNFADSINMVTDTLFVTNDAEYLPFIIPDVVIQDSLLIANQKVKLTVFRKPNGLDETCVSLDSRSLEWSETHILPQKIFGMDYYVGFINETNNSGVVAY